MAPCFSINPLSESLVERMKGCSWNPACPVPLENLRYLSLSHWGYDEHPHQGELVVHERVAQEVLEIFQELFFSRFPIEKMRLIEEYRGCDNSSMEDNNTSGFCFREAIAKPGVLSKHSYGMAVDINPLYNPYIRGTLILPEKGRPYLDRSLPVKGLITEDSSCYRAFTQRGWEWGGHWVDRIDYQHFEKDPAGVPRF